MADQQERIGQQVGNYRLQQQLDKGTFGTVYLAEHLHDRSQAAVKVFSIQISSQNDLRNFLNEARMIRLRHPHIVPLLDFGMSRDGFPFLVMEYATGGTLRECHPKGARLPAAMITSYVEQLASALQYAHDHHLIHQDVKPENMLVRSDGTVLLSDFGIAKIIEQSGFNTQPILAGTPAYMAPEQSQGKPCFASDQYALAVIAYEWFSGNRPFRGGLMEVIIQHRVDLPPSLCTICPGVSPQVEQVIFKALNKTPAERFPTVAHFAEALRMTIQRTNAFNVLLEEPTASVKPAESQLPSSSRPRLSEIPPAKFAASRSIHRWRTVVILLCLILLVVTSSVGTGLLFTYRSTLTAASLATATAIAAADAYRGRDVQFGFDAAHTNWNPYEKVIDPMNVTHLAPRWSYSTGGTIDISPTVANGIVYVGSSDGNLYAFDASCHHNCPPLWSYQIGDANGLGYEDFRSSPAVVNGVIYVGSANRSGNGKFYAFDAACRHACQPLWSYSAANAVFSSPTVANGVVYVSSATNTNEINFNGKFYAFGAACRHACQPLWSYSAAGSIYSSPAVASSVVYVVSTSFSGNFGSSKFYAFDATCHNACRPLWSYPISDTIYSSPVVDNNNNIVYVGGTKLYAFDTTCYTSCHPLWSYSIPADAESGPYEVNSPAVVNGMVYVSATTGAFGGSKLYAFDASCRSTCQPIWSYSIANTIDSSPTGANGVVYISSTSPVQHSDEGKLYAFDASCRSTCQPIWSYSTTGIIDSSPVMANGVVYIGIDIGPSDGSGSPGNGKLSALGLPM